jgi:phosphate/sulfate permease
MEFLLQLLPYLVFFFKCLFKSIGFAFAGAGFMSLISETSVGATIVANVTSEQWVLQMNEMSSQIVFYTFISLCVAGVLWAVLYTIYKWIRKDYPDFAASNLEKRLNSLEQRIDIESVSVKRALRRINKRLIILEGKEKHEL